MLKSMRPAIFNHIYMYMYSVLLLQCNDRHHKHAVLSYRDQRERECTRVLS